MPNCEHQRRLRPSRVIAPVMAAGLIVLAAGCGSSTPSNESAPAATAPEAAPAESHEGGHGGGRVFFVEPKDGATVKSPVHFEFGAENFTISPVPEGTVEHPREGIGHHHLGVEMDCMPAGQEIPRGTPGWVHFGKGDKTIDMQLTPGKHKFALQAGDDQHRTIDSLCQAITIEVVP
jgi:hypothetical protein